MADPSGRRERKRKETADKLAETAWRLFESQGFEKVTMEAIAAEADVAKGTLYNHFPVKEALLQHYFHNALRTERPQLLEKLKPLPNARERMRAFFAIAADWSEARRDYLVHYLHFRMTGAGDDISSRSGTDRVFAWLIESGQESGEFRKDLPLELSVHYLSFLHLGTLLRWLHTPGLRLADEFDAMLELFCQGLVPRAR